MNRVAVACVGLLALAGGSAAAADLPRYYQPGPVYNPIYTWTGFYIGINGGGAWGRSQWDGLDTFDVSGGRGCETRNKWLATVRGRLGYAFDRFLPYFTGGLALGDINATLPVPVLPGGSISSAGWTVGAGLEVGLVSNVSLKAEYLYVDLGTFNCGLNCGLAPGGNVSFTTNIFRGGANLRF